MLAVRIAAIAAFPLAWLALTASADAQVPPRFADGLDATPAPAPAPVDDLGIVPPPPPDDVAPASPDGYPRARGAAAGATLLEVERDDLRIPSHVATRLRVLDGDLTAIGARSGNHVVDGVLSMVAGAVSVTLGVVLRDDPIAPFLYLVGGAAVARGVLNVALMPDAQGPAIAFAHMPMRTPREVETRLTFGESTLEFLADRQRLVRLLDAGISIGVAVAIIPGYLGPNDFELNNPGDYFVVIAAAISLLSGIITLVSKTEAERRWDSYRELRARLLDEAGAPPADTASATDAALARSRVASSHDATPRFVGGPVRGGGVGGLAWTF